VARRGAWRLDILVIAGVTTTALAIGHDRATCHADIAGDGLRARRWAGNGGAREVQALCAPRTALAWSPGAKLRQARARHSGGAGIAARRVRRGRERRRRHRLNRERDWFGRANRLVVTIEESRVQ